MIRGEAIGGCSWIRHAAKTACGSGGGRLVAEEVEKHV